MTHRIALIVWFLLCFQLVGCGMFTEQYWTDTMYIPPAYPIVTLTNQSTMPASDDSAWLNSLGK